MYNWETVAQAEDWLQVFVLREAGIAGRSGYRVPPEPLDYLIRWAYERQQVSKRGRGIEHVLIDRIKGASEQLWTVVNPTLDEVMENAEVWYDDRKTAAEVLATPDTWFGRLSVATDVLGIRESNAKDEERIRTMEDADGSHN